MRVFYFCDGKCFCGSSPNCAMTHPDSDSNDVCFHTLQSDHAINGTLEQNPEDRPFFVQDDIGIWEGFIGTGKENLMSRRINEAYYRKEE